MESNRLLVSHNEKYILNIHMDAIVYTKCKTILNFKTKLGNLKNPDKCCFSPNEKLVAIRNNNGLIEIYDLDTNIKISNIHGPKNYAENFCFFDNNNLLYLTNDGTICIFNILTKTISRNCYVSNLQNANFFKFSNDKYIIIGNTKNTTNIYCLSFFNNTIDTKLLYCFSKKIEIQSSCLFKNKLFLLTFQNGLITLDYNSENNVLLDEKCIFHFEQIKKLFPLDDVFSSIYKIVPNLNLKLSANLWPINIFFTSKEEYLIIAFNYGIIILNSLTNQIISKIPVNAGISSVFTTDNDQYLWFASPKGVYISRFEEILIGNYNPKEIFVTN